MPRVGEQGERAGEDPPTTAAAMSRALMPAATSILRRFRSRRESCLRNGGFFLYLDEVRRHELVGLVRVLFEYGADDGQA